MSFFIPHGVLKQVKEFNVTQLYFAEAGQSMALKSFGCENRQEEGSSQERCSSASSCGYDQIIAKILYTSDKPLKMKA